MDIMVSLKRVIYVVGESKNGLSSREIASKMNPVDLDKERNTVTCCINHYRQFFISHDISSHPNAAKRHTLSKNGRKFYEKLLLTYDPITDTQILPQNTWANKQVK